MPLSFASQNYRRWGLSFKLTLAYSLLSALIAGTLSVTLYLQLKASKAQATHDLLHDLLSLTAPQLDGDYHALIFGPEDIQTPYFDINHAKLQKFITVNSSIKRIYTIRLDAMGELQLVHDVRRNGGKTLPIGTVLEHFYSDVNKPEEALKKLVIETQMTRAYGGDLLFYGVAPILNRWQRAEAFLVIELDAGETVVELRRARALALTMFVMTQSLSMGVIWLLTKQLVVSPALRLTQATRRLAEGQWDALLPSDRNDELGDLALTFQQMSQQLQSSFTQLEERVAARTVELSIEKEKAEVASNAKSTFISTISHELKTPLNAILGFSQLMAQDGNLENKHKKRLDIISRSGEHLLKLVDDVLAMSKAEAGRTTLDIHSFDLSHMLLSLRDMMHLKASSKGIELLFHWADDIPQFIDADEGKLRQVLLNLLGNAIKFTEAGKVSLTVELAEIALENCNAMKATAIELSEDSVTAQLREKFHLKFCLVDTGPGISSEEMNMLFTPFSQTMSGRNSQEGTGLGLSISQHFTQLMGGDMKIRSQLGHGTEVMFDIVVSQSRQTFQEPERRKISSSSDTTGFGEGVVMAQLHNQLAELAPDQSELSVWQNQLQLISAEELTVLHRAAEELDEEKLAQRIDHLQHSYPQLAERLRARLDVLAFEEIMQLTQV